MTATIDPPPTADPAPRAAPDPGRFRTARATLLVDRFMTGFIKVGGAMVIIAVCGIFVFIGSQILPLFGNAEVRPLREVALPKGDYLALASDERGGLPFLVERSGRALFVDAEGDRGVAGELALPLGGAAIASADFDTLQGKLALGLDDGRLVVLRMGWPGAEGGAGTAEPLHDLALDPERRPLIDIAFHDAGRDKLAAAIVDAGDGRRGVRAASLVEKVVLGRRSGKVATGVEADLGQHIAGTPVRVLVDDAAESVVVATAEGEIFFFERGGDAFALRQRFRPFKEGPDGSIASVDFLNGGVSLVVTDRAGDNAIYSLYQQDGRRQFGRISALAKLPAGASWFDASTRTKAFLLGGGRTASLRYATTGDTRWQAEMPADIALGALNGKNDRILLVDAEDRLRVLALDDPHPEAGWRSFFGRIWYEGADAPGYQWQSTGGSDRFEPKLSLVPLIVGSLKGTLYALLFAVPIALLAAVYVSEFMKPELKLYVKPVMELMASLPSVVLGFIAALWLAPRLETAVPTIATAVVLVPAAAMALGWLIAGLPPGLRVRFRPGLEFLVLLPVLAFAVWASTHIGPLLESWICRVPDPSGEGAIADFRLWWPHVTGTPFEQRNSLVVGFVMGFAVIPIIFTISEDSLSAVPPTLRSGAFALGASRWQTAFTIILPTASAGIFSAVMIGFGRAVGETMIVVMATGNTPIMDFNIFSGMRTLSANIAVELPEAPHHGTLYRTLFLGAFVLFLMTFVVNTVAELVRQRLREKYKTV